MYQKFNSDNIVTKFIKNILNSTNIPIVNVWKPGKPLIKDLFYITDKYIIKAIKNDDVKEAYRLRWEVLDFADRCKNKSPVTENQFKHIFSEHDRYMAYIEKYGIDNGLEEAEFEYIKQLYFDKFHQKEEED